MRLNLRRAALLGIVLCGAGAAADAQSRMTGQQDATALRVFHERVADYVTLHRLLEGGIPPLRPTTDMEELRANTRALAARIQTARESVPQGAIFTPDVSAMIRGRLARALSPEEWGWILDEHATDEQGRAIRVPPLRVNMEWPSTVPMQFMPPRALLALPRLPAELQYRLIGRTLVLWDLHADLIVDLLPGAVGT
jgi:hypothetical protein